MKESYMKFFEIRPNKENRNTYYPQKVQIDHPTKKTQFFHFILIYGNQNFLWIRFHSIIVIFYYSDG